MVNATYVPKYERARNLPRLNEKRGKRRKGSFKRLFIVFLVIGIVILFRHNIIQVKVSTAKPKATVVGEGIYIQAYESCAPRVKVAFNLPECRFVSKTGTGYLIKIPKVKVKLEIAAFKPKTTIAGRNIFVQSLERGPPRFKLSFL